MRLSSLGPRILFSAVATSLVAVFLVWFAGNQAFHQATSHLDPAHVTGADLALCARAPELWAKEVGAILSVYAYDAATGTSANPAAPPLDPDLAAALPLPGARVEREARFTRVMLVRQAEAGPCSLFQATLRPPPPEVLTTHFTFLGVGGVLAMFAVAGLTLLFAVRPVVRRVRSLRDAAREVGREGYRSAGDHVGDELSLISTVLDASDTRIRADREELLARHEALERHLAEVAHDLKTPLASLLLATEELSSARADSSGADPIAARALEDTVYLDALVDNLRQATLLRHGLDPLGRAEAADLGDVTRRVAARFAALGRRRGVQVEHAVPDGVVPARCPPALAERALANLVHNAVIHGRAGGHVAVVLETGGGRFTWAVLDDGPGLPPELLQAETTPSAPALGRPTFRDDPARPRDHGLGLAITREICQRSGWNLRFDVLDGGGTRVAVEGPTADLDGPGAPR